MSKDGQILIFAYWHDKGWKQFVGATVKIWDLAWNLANLGENVVLFLPKYRFEKKNIPFRLIEIPLLDFPFLRSFSFNIALLAYLLGHFGEMHPDAIYVRRGISPVPGIFACFKKSLLIYEINDDPYAEVDAKRFNFLSRLENWLSRRTDEKMLSLSDRSYVITAPLKEKIVKNNPDIIPEKMHVLPSGANTDLYKPMDKTTSRQKLTLEPESKYICFIGTLLSHQGVDVLIKAAPTILQFFPESHFVIIGEGPMRPLWEDLAKSLDLSDKILFTGQVSYENTPVWLNAMDICTAPFLKCAGLRSPVKIFDYLACGKPVVASRIPGTTDMFEDSGAIDFIEPENSGELAGSVVRLLGDEEKADAMGRNGRKYVENHYSRKKIAEQIQRDVQILLEKRGKGDF